MNGFTFAKQFCRSENWETRNEFNSKQPPLMVCVRIEINTRVGRFERTCGMRLEFQRPDCRYQRRELRSTGTVGKPEGERDHRAGWLRGDPAMECLQCQQLRGLGRLERQHARQR